MDQKIEHRKNQRFVVIEDLTKVVKGLKSGEIIVDLSISGAKIISLEPKKIGESITFIVRLPHELGSIEIKGKNIRSKMVRFESLQLYETGIQFEGLSQIDEVTLKRFISFLERDKIISEGREKIKELLSATKKLKKNLLILKCNLKPKKENDTTN